MAATAAFALSGCASETVEVREGFYGSLAVEEPRAALLARDVLASCGSAADASVATYFALAATHPSSAGLGATGSCPVVEPATPPLVRTGFFSDPNGSAAG